MANRDYVKRGRGNSGKKATSKKSPSRKPWRSGLLAVLLVGIFGYGLYTLSNDPEPPQPVVKQAKPKPKPKKILPAPPEEKWDYVESLPNREIEVTAKEQVVSEIPYIMQCGAYTNAAQAEARKLDIAFQASIAKYVKKRAANGIELFLAHIN